MMINKTLVLNRLDRLEGGINKLNLLLKHQSSREEFIEQLKNVKELLTEVKVIIDREKP